MKAKILKNRVMQICVAIILMAFCAPMNADAQFWKKWFKKKKKKEKIEQVIDTLPHVVLPDSTILFGNENTDTINGETVLIDSIDIDTDINYLDVLSMLSILKDLNLEDIETYRIPMDGKFSDDNYENMSVLIYDKSNIEELNKIIYG